ADLGIVGFHILSSLPRLFRGNEKYENLTRPQSIEQICDSELLNLGSNLCIDGFLSMQLFTFVANNI
ncbi:MAG: hypothetical protein PF517_14185, partial [Salinivirgaceae bacterium]|nr:hypothetical protein [Salinivirgaceae bacterium]